MRQDKAVKLHQLAAICDLKRVAAARDASEAAQNLRETEQLRAEQDNRYRQAEQGWLAALNARSFDIETVALWSAALQREDASLQSADAEVVRDNDSLERKTAVWRRATNHSEALHDLARDALRKQQHRREELALQDAADRHLQRAVEP